MAKWKSNGKIVFSLQLHVPRPVVLLPPVCAINLQQKADTNHGESSAKNELQKKLQFYLLFFLCQHLLLWLNTHKFTSGDKMLYAVEGKRETERGEHAQLGTVYLAHFSKLWTLQFALSLATWATSASAKRHWKRNGNVQMSTACIS